MPIVSGEYRLLRLSQCGAIALFPVRSHKSLCCPIMARKSKRGKDLVEIGRGADPIWTPANRLARYPASAASAMKRRMLRWVSLSNSSANVLGEQNTNFSPNIVYDGIVSSAS